MNRENFSFSSKVLLGDFLQPAVGEEYVRLSEEQVMKRLEEMRLSRSLKSRSGSHRSGVLPSFYCTVMNVRFPDEWKELQYASET